MRIAATPAAESDGPRLADEILAAIAPLARDPQGEPKPAPADENSAGPRPPADAGAHVTQEYES